MGRISASVETFFILIFTGLKLTLTQ